MYGRHFAGKSRIYLTNWRHPESGRVNFPRSKQKRRQNGSRSGEVGQVQVVDQFYLFQGGDTDRQTTGTWKMELCPENPEQGILSEFSVKF